MGMGYVCAVAENMPLDARACRIHIIYILN
jgi:hypothetical protein